MILVLYLRASPPAAGPLKAGCKLCWPVAASMLAYRTACLDIGCLGWGVWTAQWIAWTPELAVWALDLAVWTVELAAWTVQLAAWTVELAAWTVELAARAS